MCSDINHLCHKLETAEKFIEVVHDKYASCLKDKSIGIEFQKLQYTIMLTNFKANELEQNVQDNDDDEEVTQRRASNGKSFQEFLPHSRETGTTRAEVKGLKASQPGQKISLGHLNASNPKTPANTGRNGSKDYSFLFKYSRWGGEGNAYNGNPNRKRNDDTRRPKRSANPGGSPGGNDPDDNTDGTEDDDTLVAMATQYQAVKTCIIC